MCLAIPSQIKEILEDGFAVVETWGVRKVVSLHLLQEEIKEGDFVLIHVGYAIGKISQEDALESLKIYNDILNHMKENENEEDRYNK